MNNAPILFLLFLLAKCPLIAVTDSSSDPVFGGFDAMANYSKVVFDTVYIDPLFLKKTVDQNTSLNYYREVYELNKIYGIKHHCSSYDYIITGGTVDSLEFLGEKISISRIAKDKRLRFFNILRFIHKSEEYFLFIGKDMLSGGNFICSDIIFLLKKSNGSIKIACPPFIKDDLNTSAFIPNYLNDFDEDGKLDFLQLRNTDTIAMYSLYENTFVKRNEFIKLYKKPSENNIFYIDIKGSNWPFKSIESKEKKELNCQLGYEKYHIKGICYYDKDE